MTTLPKLDTISSEEIKDIIDEYNHQLYHLERSQSELQIALQEEPIDEELQLAYDENIDVIERRKNIISVMIKYLDENDPFFDKTFANTHQNSKITALSRNNVDTHEITQSTQSLNLEEKETEEDEEGDHDDRGMYL